MPIHKEGEGDGELPEPPLYSFCDDHEEENSALLGQGLASWDHQAGRILFQVF